MSSDTASTYVQGKGDRYPNYRWVVLAVVSLLYISTELHFMIFSSIISDAASYYGVSEFSINLVSVLFFIALVVLGLPAVWVINRIGLRRGMGIGALLLGVFGGVKMLFPDSYAFMMACEALLACAQPFIINASTRISTVWFPVKERATITSVLTLAQFVGMGIAMVFSPVLLSSGGMETMNLVYGILSICSAVLFFVFMKDRPISTSSNAQETRSTTVEGVRTFFTSRSALILLFTFFIGMGLFNAISTCLSQILAPMHFSSGFVGMLGGLMLLFAIVASFVWGLVSDRLGRRKPVLIGVSLLFVPSLLMLGFSTNTAVVVTAVILFGIACGTSGLGYQYAAEVTQPAPETVSQSIIQTAGAIAGTLFVTLMEGFGDHTSMALVVFTILVMVSLVAQTRLIDVHPHENSEEIVMTM